jgi:IclR family pca regulon transcriptional regulator
MGRILMMGQGRAVQEAYLSRTDLIRRMPNTRIAPSDLFLLFDHVAQEAAIVDQELGLRSAVVPVTSARGVVAAVNIGTQGARASITELRGLSAAAPPRAWELNAMGLA